MKVKSLAGVLSVCAVAIVFWTGCPPTMNLNGYYEYAPFPRSGTGIQVVTTFPSNSFTGVYRVFVISYWQEYPISGAISATNELSFSVPVAGGPPWNYVMRGLDYDNDGVADALECIFLNGADCTGEVIPKVG